MAGIRWLETDTASNQNISAATAVGAYTAAADRAIMVQVFVDAVAGNGDYVMYATLQIGGAGSAYVILPKTTMAAASGETAIGGQSGWINVRNADVVTVYVDGLAGDTTTPDYTTRWFEDAALQPTTADMTLDVSATGEAGLDFNNIKAATGATTLTNITVPVVTTTGTATAVTTLNGIAAGVITAAAIATGAIDADALATDAVNEIVDQVWNETTADHVTAGSMGKALGDAGAAGDPWAAATRTLTQTAAAVTAAVSGATITIQRGDTFSATITGLAANTDYVSIDFTVKASPDDTDDQAILRIRKNASLADDGLLRLNGAALVSPVVATDGSITVNSATSITIALAARASDDLLDADGLFYDIQCIFAATVTTLTAGMCNVTADVTRAIA